MDNYSSVTFEPDLLYQNGQSLTKIQPPPRQLGGPTDFDPSPSINPLILSDGKNDRDQGVFVVNLNIAADMRAILVGNGLRR